LIGPSTAMRAEGAHARKGAGQGELTKRARQALAAVVSEALRADAHSVDLNFSGALWCRLHIKAPACKQATAQDDASGEQPDKGDGGAEMQTEDFGFADISADMAAEQEAAAPCAPAPAPAASPPREAMQVAEPAQPRGQKREAPVAPPARPANVGGGSQPASRVGRAQKVDKNSLSACGHSSGACSAGVPFSLERPAGAAGTSGSGSRGRGAQVPEGRGGGRGGARGYATVLAAAHTERRSWEAAARKIGRAIVDERQQRERAAAEETLRLRDAVDDAFERGRQQGAGGWGRRGRPPAGWAPGVG